MSEKVKKVLSDDQLEKLKLARVKALQVRQALAKEKNEIKTLEKEVIEKEKINKVNELKKKIKQLPQETQETQETQEPHGKPNISKKEKSSSESSSEEEEIKKVKKKKPKKKIIYQYESDSSESSQEIIIKRRRNKKRDNSDKTPIYERNIQQIPVQSDPLKEYAKQERIRMIRRINPYYNED